MTVVSTVKQSTEMLVEQNPIQGVRVLVYGHHPKIRPNIVQKCLDTIFDSGDIIEEIVHDRTSPVAKAAAAWAQTNGAMEVIFPDLWSQNDDNRIGRILCSKPDVIILFSDGQHDLDMVRMAERLNIKLWVPPLKV